jgi:hypothetical protein
LPARSVRSTSQTYRRFLRFRMFSFARPHIRRYVGFRRNVKLCDPCAEMSRTDVRFGSKADMCSAIGNVRFAPEVEHFNDFNGVDTRLTPFCSWG